MKKIPVEKGTVGITINLLKRLNGHFQHGRSTKIGIALYSNKTQYDNIFQGFEVHLIRKQKETTRIYKNADGKEVKITYSESEIIANSKEFGAYAWSFPNLSDVYHDFPQFQNHHDEIVSRLHEITFKSAFSRQPIEQTQTLNGLIQARCQ